MISPRFLRLLRPSQGRTLFAAPLASLFVLSLLVFAVPAALLLGGCGGGKDRQAEREHYLSRLIMVHFNADVPQAQRESLFQKYQLRVEGPFGGLSDAYLLFVPDHQNFSTVHDSLLTEPSVRQVLANPIGFN